MKKDFIIKNVALVSLCIGVSSIQAQRPTSAAKPPKHLQSSVKPSKMQPRSVKTSKTELQPKFVFQPLASHEKQPSLFSKRIQQFKAWWNRPSSMQTAQEKFDFQKQVSHQIIKDFDTFLADKKPQNIASVVREYRKSISSPQVAFGPKNALVHAYGNYMLGLKKDLYASIERNAQHGGFTTFLDAYRKFKKIAPTFDESANKTPISSVSKSVLVNALLNKYARDISLTTQTLALRKKQKQVEEILKDLSDLYESHIRNENRSTPVFSDCFEAFKTVGFDKKKISEMLDMVTLAEGSLNTLD